MNAAPKQLLKFWTHLSSDSSINELFTQYATSYWEGVRMLFPFIELPSNEALRRYMYTGVSNSIGQTHVFFPRFFAPIPTQIYNKFYDFFPLSSWWYQFDKEPLKRSIKKFATFPISMNINFEDINKRDNEHKNRWPEVGKWIKEHRLDPRLLLVSVDIDEGATVTFDSYPYIGKECQICKAAIPKNNSSNNENNILKEEKNKFTSPEDLIEHIDKVHRQNYGYRNLKNSKNIHWSVYDDDDGKCLFYDGIEPEHVIASASIPKNYAFEIIDGHKFWDGGILSNTPLRELISHHITWWSDKRELEPRVDLSFENWNKSKDDLNIPDLELYIVNLHPTKEGKEGETNYHIEEDDYDMIKDRENYIIFHDNTEYDQKVATLVTDFIKCIDKMGDLAIEAINQTGDNSEPLKYQFNNLLNDPNVLLSTKRTGEKRTIQELIKNRFELKVKFKIERKDDIDTISNKVFDFSSNTITRLIKEGIGDSLDYLVRNDYLVEKDKEAKKCSPEETHQHLLMFIASIGETTLEKEEIYMKDLATNLAKEKLKEF